MTNEPRYIGPARMVGRPERPPYPPHAPLAISVLAALVAVALTAGLAYVWPVLVAWMAGQ